MTEDQKRQIHPIVERAMGMAYKGAEPIEFDDYAVEQLQDLLREYFEKQELVQAVQDLIKLAFFLDKKGCHAASKKIIKVVESATEALNALKNHIKKTHQMSKND